MYAIPLIACRLKAGDRRLAPGGGGSGPEGGGAGRMGKTLVMFKLSVSLGRLCKTPAVMKLSLSLGRSGSTVELLDVRGGKMGRSNTVLGG